MPCSECIERPCFTGKGTYPKGCPEKAASKPDLTEKAASPDNAFASRLHSRHPSRLSDLIAYAKEKNVKHIGVACCVGLHDETRLIVNDLKHEGFEVSAMICKAGGLLKADLGVPPNCRVTTRTGFSIGSVACNPVGQALVFNKEETDLNVAVGLCAGHDSLFYKFSKAPTICLIAKDRSNGHNPASILYNYYGDTFFNRKHKFSGSLKHNLLHLTPVDMYRFVSGKNRRQR